jgi:hypothetical protein
MESHGRMISTGICPPELSGNPTKSHLVAKQEEHAKGNAEWSLYSDSSILIGFFKHAVTTWDQWLYFLSEGSSDMNFYHP